MCQNESVIKLKQYEHKDGNYAEITVISESQDIFYTTYLRGQNLVGPPKQTGHQTVNGKVSLCLIKHHSMKTYEVWRYI